MRSLLKTVLVTGALIAGLASPAGAQTIRVHDGRDTHASQELLGLRVKYANMLNVAMRFSTNYFMRGEVPYTIWYDTDPKNPGPEYALYEHFGSVYRVNGWAGGLGREVHCFVTGVRNADRHVWRITVSDKCFGRDKGPIRVSVDAMALTDGRPYVVDWVPGEHQWTPFVAKLGQQAT